VGVEQWSGRREEKGLAGGRTPSNNSLEEVYEDFVKSVAAAGVFVLADHVSFHPLQVRHVQSYQPRLSKMAIYLFWFLQRDRKRECSSSVGSHVISVHYWLAIEAY
jgi:hypothetical protein